MLCATKSSLRLARLAWLGLFWDGELIGGVAGCSALTMMGLLGACCMFGSEDVSAQTTEDFLQLLLVWVEGCLSTGFANRIFRRDTVRWVCRPSPFQTNCEVIAPPLSSPDWHCCYGISIHDSLPPWPITSARIYQVHDRIQRSLRHRDEWRRRWEDLWKLHGEDASPHAHPSDILSLVYLIQIPIAWIIKYKTVLRSLWSPTLPRSRRFSSDASVLISRCPIVKLEIKLAQTQHRKSGS